MKIIIIYIIGILIFMCVAVNQINSEVNYKPMVNYSSTYCVGHTCTNYLLSQMYNNSMNTSLINTSLFIINVNKNDTTYI